MILFLQTYPNDDESDYKNGQDCFNADQFCQDKSSQQHSITKFAEAANIGMKRLRRNWSNTKNEVKTGLNKIKKKSTFNMSDIKPTEMTSKFIALIIQYYPIYSYFNLFEFII